MRGKKNVFANILLFLGSVGCAILFILFIRKEEGLTAVRQAEVNALTEDLKPINDERKKWQDEDKQWQKTLDEKTNGESCMLLAVDSMERNVYDTIFVMMAQYGFKATFTLKDGQMPEDPETKERDKVYIDSEQFQEMLDAGWEYAVSVSEPETSGEAEDGQAGQHEEADDSVTEQEGWITQLDAALARLEENKLEQPLTVFAPPSRYSAGDDAELIERGFKGISIVNSNKTPTIAQTEGDLLHIDSSLLTQNNMSIEQVMDTAAANRQSMAVTVNKVLRISKDGDSDVSIVKFTSFFNKLKSMEEQGLFQIMTYSEYYDYQRQLARNKGKLQNEYKAFKQEMGKRMAELDQQEEEIVSKTRTETVK